MIMKLGITLEDLQDLILRRLVFNEKKWTATIKPQVRQNPELEVKLPMRTKIRWENYFDPLFFPMHHCFHPDFSFSTLFLAKLGPSTSNLGYFMNELKFLFFFFFFPLKIWQLKRLLFLFFCIFYSGIFTEKIKLH